jgi:mono/diheme cytochrome c family protein
MSNFESGHRRARLGPLAVVALAAILAAACRRDMQDQPRYEINEPSRFFDNGAASRPIPDHTVPRGFLRENDLLYTGRLPKGARTAAAQSSQPFAGAQTPQRGAATGDTGAAQFDADLATRFPFAITAEGLNRGRDRFQTFCAMCHGLTGEGDGMVVRRGYRRPPSYHEDRLRRAPVGHFFDVMTNGWGAMPAYNYLVQPGDRWLIAAYIRALQLSRSAKLEELPEAERRRIVKELGQPQPSPAPAAPGEGGGRRR